MDDYHHQPRDGQLGASEKIQKSLHGESLKNYRG